MSKVEYTEQNREKLAEAVVDSMDMKTLMQVVYEDTIEFYEGQDGDEYFQRDWQDMMGDEDE